jgi:hypothetical protein
VITNEVVKKAAIAGVIFVVSGRVRPMDALDTGFATTFF